MKQNARISAIQAELHNQGDFACIIPSTDPHMSEYVAPRWEGRSWASGFHGSAGTLVVTRTQAALWTDGRYFLEASRVLEGSGIQLMKMGLPGTPEIPEWIGSARADSDPSASRRIVIASESFSVAQFMSLQHSFSSLSLELIGGPDILDQVWDDRPSLPSRDFYEIPSQYCGETRAARLSRLRDWLSQTATNSEIAGNADTFLLTALDEIAWILNLRGNDVSYNPVFYAYLLVKPGETVLYTHHDDMSADIRSALQSDGVRLADYQEVYSELENDTPTLAADPSSMNLRLFEIIEKRWVKARSPVGLWKSCKNETELASTRDVMERDGVAMVQLLFWLEQQIAHGNSLSELELSEKITACRKTGDRYVGDSFPSIVGYGPNGAIIHYRVSAESSRPIVEGNLLLIDSGGQYADGTTDITRTVAIGSPSPEQIRHHSLVLKGNIQLSLARFPRGTKGIQLDVLARRSLWDSGLDYGHGTGHGVGFALNVHEGPQKIHRTMIDQELLPGMISSNEPGFYREGEYGIRFENLEVVVESARYPGFLEFETLTLCPIDRRLIDPGLLSREELDWLNNYNREVFKRLGPLLEPELASWLEGQTAEF